MIDASAFWLPVGICEYNIMIKMVVVIMTIIGYFIWVMYDDYYNVYYNGVSFSWEINLN